MPGKQVRLGNYKKCLPFYSANSEAYARGERRRFNQGFPNEMSRGRDTRHAMERDEGFQFTRARGRSGYSRQSDLTLARSNLMFPIEMPDVIRQVNRPGKIKKKCH